MADDGKTKAGISDHVVRGHSAAGQGRKAFRSAHRTVAGNGPSAGVKAVRAKKRISLVGGTFDQRGAQSASTGIPFGKLIAGLLIISVVLNVYLFYNNSLLNEELGGINAVIKPSEGGTMQTTTPSSPGKAGDRVKLGFYVMSHCPYGIQVLTGIAPVLKKIGGSVDFTVNFIGKESGGAFTSMHGPAEVDDDLRELCAMKYYPDSYKFMDFVVCRGKDPQGTDWESCATDNGMDSAKIKACAEGDEGRKLLSDSFKASAAAKAKGSPTMYLNGALYSKGRTEADFMRAICNGLKNPPAECGNLSAPVKFGITIINDKRCTTCSTASLEQKLSSLFAGASIKKVDYGTPEGKQLYDSTGIQLLPAVLFDDTVKQDSSYSQIQKSLVKVGSTSSFKTGAAWDPYCDPTTDHCNESRCSGRMSCRNEMPKRIDLFVMGHCPFGIQAMNSMKEVLGAFKDMSFHIHYIGGFDTSTGKFKSMHGQTEVDDDLREICAMKYYPDSYKFMDFIWCRNNNTSGDWQKCFTDSGMDAAKIKACAEGPEGAQLLSADMDLSNKLSIGSSPTWLANNKYKFGGVTADGVRSNYCKYNHGLPGCDKTLSTDTGGVPASGGCG